MTDMPLPAKNPRRFRFERHASTILLLASVALYIALIIIMGVLWNLLSEAKTKPLPPIVAE